uniref:Uncharacterized protein n=1 Tax=Ditylenchus dipsaci TaxID=166011 RepID=A0A915CUB3_9BILA
MSAQTTNTGPKPPIPGSNHQCRRNDQYWAQTTNTGPNHQYRPKPPISGQTTEYRQTNQYFGPEQTNIGANHWDGAQSLELQYQAKRASPKAPIPGTHHQYDPKPQGRGQTMWAHPNQDIQDNNQDEA